MVGFKDMHKIEKATLTKVELMQYLGIGETKLKRLFMNPSFPRQKPIIEKWSKIEIDHWLTKDVVLQQQQQHYNDFI